MVARYLHCLIRKRLSLLKNDIIDSEIEPTLETNISFISSWRAASKGKIRVFPWILAQRKKFTGQFRGAVVQ